MREKNKITGRWLMGIGALGALLLAMGQLNDRIVLGVIGIILLFITSTIPLNARLKNVLIGSAVLVFLYMSLMTAWFRNIEALGWKDIAGLPPQFWLLLAVALVSVACSVAAATVYTGAQSLFRKVGLSSNSIIYAYGWALVMVSVELTLSSLFSLFTKAPGGIVAPTWNMFSTALMSGTNFIGYAGQILGFWGVSFLLYFTSACIVILVRRAVSKKSLVIPVVNLVFISAILLAGYVLKADTSGKDVTAVAINRNGDQTYLENISKELLELSVNKESPVIVSLPEYSSLISPFANTAVIGPGYDARYTYPKLFENYDIYFVGTEDQYINNKRYVENYIANGRLERIKRKPKTFLIPGGEYVVGWVGDILERVDEDSSYLFTSSRARNVITDELSPDTVNPIANQIGIGSCSSILTPYHFRSEVAKGAGILAVNISYEQFNKAMEYENFANRFAQFTAKATARSIIFGADDGASKIYDERGNLIISSRTEPLVSASVKLQTFKTPYSLLGDKIILLILSLPAGLFFLAKTRTHKSKIMKLLRLK